MPYSSASVPVPQSPGSRSHTGGSPSSTWAWSSEKARKRMSRSAPFPQGVDRRLVAVAGERAAVVEGQSERAGHRLSLAGGHDEGQPVGRIRCSPAAVSGRDCPTHRFRACPSARPTRGAHHDVGGVVHADVDPAVGDDGGQRVPGRPAPVGEQDRGGERRGGVAGGERRRDRSPHAVGERALDEIDAPGRARRNIDLIGPFVRADSRPMAAANAGREAQVAPADRAGRCR